MNRIIQPLARWARISAVLVTAATTLSSCALLERIRGGGDGDRDGRRSRAHSLGDYRLAAGSQVGLAIYRDGQLESRQDLVVAADGNVAISGVGDVSVDGMAPLDAAKKIEFLARAPGENHLRGPRAHITALDRQAVAHVSGHVNEPGPVTLLPGLTVAEAIDAAGGATADGNAGAVGLTVNGRKIIVTSTGTRELRAGDVINVPERL